MGLGMRVGGEGSEKGEKTPSPSVVSEDEGKVGFFKWLFGGEVRG